MSRANFSTPTGDCFSAAGAFATRKEILDYPDDYRLVHGNIQSLNQEEPINHAWVEEGQIVHEVSSGRHLTYAKAAYYEHHGVNYVRSYTPEEALLLSVRHLHWGPWD